MSESCFKKNELLIPGTRQDERLCEALDPKYVQPDERTIANLLVFISKYAELINYFALKGDDPQDYVIDGNWKPLIMSDEAFHYAEISVTPHSIPNVTFSKYITLYENGSTVNKRHDAYRVLWDILFSVYKDINRFYTELPLYMSLRSEVGTEISNGMVSDFGIAAGAYINSGIAIASPNLLLPTANVDDDYKFDYAEDIIAGSFHKIWIDANLAPTATSWDEYTTDLAANPGLANNFFNAVGLTSDFDRIDYSTLRLKQLFRKAFEAYARIITKANNFLQHSLDNNAGHYAHHGLMLTFLKLFGVLQDDINGFTRKHLEYYYSRVLNIFPAPAVPDSVHIVIEPARNADTHLLEKSTPLNAGKDATGKLLLYNTYDEIVVNQSKVAELKTLFLQPNSATAITKVFASPVANSADGLGADFTEEDKSWKGFGNNSNEASLGFFIASPILHLTEGKRTIDFTFTSNAAGIAKMAALTQASLLPLFNFACSGEKQWEELIIMAAGVTDYNSTLVYTPPTLASSTFTITLILLPQFKPVVGYDAAVCEGNLDTILPTIRFSLNQATANAYQLLKDISISSVNITVTAEDITSLSIQNELGTLDATKPVHPFGPVPKIGSAFYIGHTEIEYKQINSLELTLKWLEYNSDLRSHYKYQGRSGSSTTIGDQFYVDVANNSAFKASLSFIRNKNWVTVNADSSFLANPTTILNNAVVSLAKSLITPETFTTDDIVYTPQTQNGFIRLTLTSPDKAFGHSKWATVFAQQTVAMTQNAANTIPLPPFTPLLENMRLKYVATQVIPFGSSYHKTKGQFIHQLPFGVKEIKSGALLLPTFEVEKKLIDSSIGDITVESVLYIGISDAIVNQNISILLQVNAGTEDISVDSPSINWNYLSKTGWKHLDKSLLADSTGNLLNPGIVTFQVPNDITTTASELPSGLCWICAAIERGANPLKVSSEGLPKLLVVHSNAVKATFMDNGNSPEHLAKSLAAGKISKLYESDAAVKKIVQPFASFGGKKIEEGAKFYTRASERLRHKRRAITIWDYERLVLNEFPEVFMAKCLNHTGYEIECPAPPNTSQVKHYRENIPGQVMIVPVPLVTNLQTGNKFQPTLSSGKLKDIENFIHGFDDTANCNKYIKALHCQLATLWVENAKYETIKVICKVQVNPCLDQLFYQNQLIEDLNEFLSPWITGDAGKISFGGRLHSSQVVFFIEKRPYIDYVIDLSIEHRENNNLVNVIDPSIAMTTTSRSVLTSFGTHTIQPANP